MAEIFATGCLATNNQSKINSHKRRYRDDAKSHSSITKLQQKTAVHT